MASYHCPYCNALILHRRELAGERVACSKCRGEYYEPTDPLPGMLPEKAEPVEAAAAGSIGGPAVQNPVAASRPSRTLSHANDITTCDPSDMVAELTRRGDRALIVTWKAGHPAKTEVTIPDGVVPSELNDAILFAALPTIQAKWPDIYETLMNRWFS